MTWEADHWGGGQNSVQKPHRGYELATWLGPEKHGGNARRLTKLIALLKTRSPASL